MGWRQRLGSGRQVQAVITVGSQRLGRGGIKDRMLGQSGP
jgi:hypothetical protein